MTMRRVLVVAILLALATLLPGLPPVAAAAAGRAARAEQAARVDFNGDGFADLAVGAPGEGIGAAFAAGAVNVLYGSAAGLQPSTDVFYQGPGGAGGVPERDDRFGAAVARGDFDGDGFFDLAVGAPGEDVGTATGAGAISVLRGSSGGLTGGELFTQANAEDGDEFGSSLATGLLAGDDLADLVVGAPSRTSAPPSTPGRSTSSPARPPAWSTAPCSPRATLSRPTCSAAP